MSRSPHQSLSGKRVYCRVRSGDVPADQRAVIVIACTDPARGAPARGNGMATGASPAVVSRRRTTRSGDSGPGPIRGPQPLDARSARDHAQFRPTNWYTAAVVNDPACRWRDGGTSRRGTPRPDNLDARGSTHQVHLYLAERTRSAREPPCRATLRWPPVCSAGLRGSLLGTQVVVRDAPQWPPGKRS